MKKHLLSFTVILLLPLLTVAQTPSLSLLGSYQVPGNVFDEGAAEIPAYHAASQRVFFTDAFNEAVQVIDISNPAQPVSAGSLMLSGGPNSVAVYGDLVAVAVEADPKQDPGKVEFYNASTLAKLAELTVGALPDMLTFTEDGSYLLVANEGEPDDDYAIDPEGSISIITIPADLSMLSSTTVRTAGFESFNSQVEILRSQGVRIFGPGATVAQDLEPEYITTQGDQAWVICQENNTLAVVDIASATVSSLLPLGTKDHSLSGNHLDASNRDNAINIAAWPVKGMYMPDAIASYQVGGETYIVTANEGDARDYDGFSEEDRVADLLLDPTAFPDAATLQEDENLGRLLITTTLGDTDGDGDYDELYSYGARSFSIWDASGNLVFDSGDAFETFLAQEKPDFFNATNDENNFDNRSDDKGPEPEGVALATIGASSYAFIGLERIGGIMFYDISNPQEPVFLDYINNRDFTASEDDIIAGNGLDLGPEGLIFVDAADSPNQEALLVVTNEISGTVSIYQVNDIATVAGFGDAERYELRAYPNPARSQVRITASQPLSKVELYSTSGQLLHSISSTSPEQVIELNLSGMEKGLYLIRAYDHNLQALGLLRLIHQ